MNKSERGQMYCDYLRAEGYLPQLDADQDVAFKCEGRSYFIQVSEKDEEFFRLIFPNFWSIENDAERVKVEKAALKATLETKVAKVFPVKDNVWGAIELFCNPPENFKSVFKRSMSALRSAVDNFVETMRA